MKSIGNKAPIIIKPGYWNDDKTADATIPKETIYVLNALLDVKIPR